MKQQFISRRTLFKWGAGVAVSTALSPLLHGEEDDSSRPDRARFLDEVERRAFRYFYEQADADTGLVRDHALNEGRESSTVASIAATGFGLSALAIADRRGYLDGREIRKRLQRTLEFLAARSANVHGFYHHFLDMRTGERVWGSEISSIDTTWLLCGILHCRSHFANSSIDRLANEILDRVEWQWMLDGSLTLSHGWLPESGFLPYRWDSYAELLAMYLLAIGSKNSPIPAESWHAWARPRHTYEGLTYIDAWAPLFAHQYSHAWFDFRGRHDAYADYFDNSCRATMAHRLYCASHEKQFPWYGAGLWGVTCSDSRIGYSNWSGTVTSCELDGTLVPCAAGGSIVFLPQECTRVLENMLDRFGKRVWGRYGFVDAFHPKAEWYSPHTIGIDAGIMMLMTENRRSQSVWQSVMAAPEAIRAMDAVELV